jgi:MoaA/NifB/PqqE/SkfB family radical SAM enzyme
MLEALAALRDRHGIVHMLWMGGEPLLRKGLVVEGVKLFASNTVTTNGTIPLVDLGPDVLYVVSLDGPPEVNDAVRGEGTFNRVMSNLEALPDGFTTPIQVQCTVTPNNQDHLRELVEAIVDTRVAWVTFSFVVPSAGDVSDAVWADLESRMVAVEAVRRLKVEFPSFVRNRSTALDLMAPESAPAVVADCPSKKILLPLWLDGDHLTTPFCCYGDDVDCQRCGAWVVFDLASRAVAPPAVAS